jgi:hypothetical protein
LNANFILSRALDDNRPDAEMKRAKLFALFADLKVPFARWTRNATFYDDNAGVIAMAERYGILAKNAKKLNLQLTKQA